MTGIELLGATLLHFLWEGIFIAAIYAVVRRCASRPEIRYLLACAALAAMAVSPVATWLVLRPVSPERVAAPALFPTSHAVSVASGFTGDLPGLFAAGLERVPSAWLSWVAAAWMAGVLLFWLRLLGGWMIANRLRRQAQPAPNQWQQAFDELRARLRVSRPVRLLASGLVQAPAVVGLLRPVVLVPAGALAGLPADQLEAVLLHELAHIRRYDYLVNALQSMVEALLFYHPAVWWVSGHMRSERELCCDDRAVAVTGDARNYAHALAEIGAASHAHYQASVAATGGSLANRIARLLGEPRPASRTHSPAAVAVTGLLVAMIVVTASPGISQQAQTITGTWQGLLKTEPQEIRIVMKISLEDRKLKAVTYNIDQRVEPLASTVISQNGSAVKIIFGALGGTYEGRLSADGNSITGAWTRTTPVSLNLARATPRNAWTIPEPPPPPVRMAADIDPGIEVATIKPSDPNRRGKLFTLRGQNVVTINTTTIDLVTLAWDVQAGQIKGGPAWLQSEQYDLLVKPDVPGQPNVAQMKIILQKLLADRFQLKFHREKQDFPVYAITVANGGAKLSRSQSDPDSNPGLFFDRAKPGMTFTVRNATIAEVAAALQRSGIDKPVVDQTGLSGKYDFILKFTPDAATFGPQPPAADDLDAPPDLFTAFRQQLGLKLDSTRAPTDVLVIDRVEKPSPN